MRIVITEWGLASYLDHRRSGLFSVEEYYAVLRPDILRLRDRSDPKFRDSRFWGPAQDLRGRDIEDGFKMKWHNFGNGNVQFRLCVALVGGDAYLCQAYVKSSVPTDHRMASSLKDKVQLIRQGRHVERGEL